MKTISAHCAALALVLIGSARAWAQGPAPTPLTSPAGSPPPTKAIEMPAKPHALTRDDLEAFLDALVPSQLENRNGAGAVVGAVKDGQVLLTKGYGFADFEKRKPVLPGETLFRPGSISKLFTAIAVMQLVEQGKLDLDRDVADYIDFQIPRKYAEPITLRRLLTHTAGFEETLKNLFVPSSSSMRPLRDYLIASMPAQIFQPGKVASYSNWGLTLAGYIVQLISGEKFEDYLNAHIFLPLRMEHSSFAQPLPQTLSAGMSNGYISATDKPIGFEFVQATPAGALAATADDICRFMLALVGKGTLEGATIIKPGTLQQMQSRQYEAHTALNGVGLVFMQYDTNGIGAWGHGGDTIAFHSDLWIVPDANFGFFISYNSAMPRPGGGRGEVQRALFDRYFPRSATEASGSIEPEAARADAHAVGGTYQSSRRSETTLLKVGALFGEAVVRPNADATISIDISKNLRGQVRRWREVAPLVFHEVNGPEKIAFRRDANGTVVELVAQPSVYELQRTVWYESKTLLLPAIGACVSVLVLTVLLAPVAALVRRRYGQPLFVERSDRLLYLLTRLVCALLGVWLIILVVLSSRAGTDISLLGNGLDPWLQILHVLGWAFAVGTLLLIIVAIRQWRMPILSRWARVHSTLLALAALTFVWFAWHYHLLDPSLRF